MEQFFTTISGTITAIGIVAAVVISGVLYIVGLYSKRKRELKENEDKDGDRLIKILQTTVDELQGKVDKQDADIKELSAEVGKLRSENRTLMEVLQGRDKQTQLFYEEGFKAMKTAAEILMTVKGIETTIHDKNESVSKLIDVVKENARVVLEAAKLQTK